MALKGFESTTMSCQTFLAQAVKRVPLSVYCDGFQSRSLCKVKNMMGGTVKMMEDIKSLSTFNPGIRVIKRL